MLILFNINCYSALIVIIEIYCCKERANACILLYKIILYRERIAVFVIPVIIYGWNYHVAERKSVLCMI